MVNQVISLGEKIKKHNTELLVNIKILCYLLEKRCKIMLHKCPDCNCDIDIPFDAGESEIFVCPDCGLEFEYKNGILIQLSIENEDFGE
jgi:hypothetical protein